jgi:hypothetical protein
MIPALIVGALTAWYLGLRAGAIAAVATFAALVLSTFVPGLTLAVYALVIAWTAALWFMGAKISKKAGASSPSSWLGGATGTAYSWARKWMKKG